MSNNLYKRFYTNLQKEEIRVIDVNPLLEKRLGELEERYGHNGLSPFGGGFVEGLCAEHIEAVENGEEGNSGNVIKAGQDARILIEQAQAQAEHILAKAREDAEEIRSELLRQTQAECGVLKEDAKRQGYEEGIMKVRQEAEQMKHDLEAYQKELDKEYQRQIDTLEPEFVDTITGIYEHIFHVELDTYHDILVYLANDAMRKTEGSRNFLIHVSKEDYPYISMQKKQITAGVASANISVEIVEDVTLDRNDCMIETDGGILDCGTNTQLDQLRQRLLLLSYEE